MKPYTITKLLLKLAVAGVFIYAALAATFQPDNWIGFFPPFLVHLMPVKLLLIGFSIFQIVLALWILSGKLLFYSALLAAFTLVAIIVANIGVIDIVFRDIAIFFAALALASYSKEW